MKKVLVFLMLLCIQLTVVFATPTMTQFPHFYQDEPVYLVVGDDAPATDVLAASDIARAIIALRKEQEIITLLASEVGMADNKHIIAVGNPCTNPLVASLLQTNHCIATPKADGMISLTENTYGKYHMVVAGNNDEATQTTALFIAQVSGDNQFCIYTYGAEPYAAPCDQEHLGEDISFSEVDLADYPTFFQNTPREQIYLVVDDNAPSSDVLVAADIADYLVQELGENNIVSLLSSEVLSLQHNMVFVGTPCDNAYIKEALGVDSCEFATPGQGVIAAVRQQEGYIFLFVSGNTPEATQQGAAWLRQPLSGTYLCFDAFRIGDDYCEQHPIQETTQQHSFIPTPPPPPTPPSPPLEEHRLEQNTISLVATETAEPTSAVFTPPTEIIEKTVVIEEPAHPFLVGLLFLISGLFVISLVVLGGLLFKLKQEKHF